VKDLKKKETKRHQNEISRVDGHHSQNKHVKTETAKVVEEKKLRFLDHQKQQEEIYRPNTPKVT